MFAQFLSIVFRSIKLDKNLYRESKSFGEAAIYFAALVMVLDGVAGLLRQIHFIKHRSVYLRLLLFLLGSFGQYLYL